MNPTGEEISVKAAKLWKKDGCRSGLEWKYWLQARKELVTPARSTMPRAFLEIACTVAKRLLKPPPKPPRDKGG